MNSSSRDHELWSELLDRLGGLVREVVPAEAQDHLFNAQKELLEALVIMYEHQAQGLRQKRGSSEAARSATTAGGVRRIKVD